MKSLRNEERREEMKSDPATLNISSNRYNDYPYQDQQNSYQVGSSSNEDKDMFQQMKTVTIKTLEFYHFNEYHQHLKTQGSTFNNFSIIHFNFCKKCGWVQELFITSSVFIWMYSFIRNFTVKKI